MRSFSDSYREAGVNIEAGYEGVKLMRRHVARTMIPGVVSDIGGFGGLFAPDIKGMAEPVLVSGTDGVGTKIRIAQLLDKHDTIGIDCVAMPMVLCLSIRNAIFSFVPTPSVPETSTGCSMPVTSSSYSPPKPPMPVSTLSVMVRAICFFIKSTAR